ncbi:MULTISPECIES: endoribonuclease YicC domain-containing protein [Candidatus Ichthyocystis]|uniref:YicC family protein n=1 Tax=Candidatus Ichthyocystis hellenicum TaxID=1561003 RepID=A0A0S4M3G4_9BURK|nr:MULTISPECIES: DUF1732 domain-containing protein [Ichthyocystis]CUT17274.1 hypothetical protein, YicC and DUF1732 domain [Candidatus Ichthyocystis hellenicum]
MIKSMTGYGNATINNNHLTIELALKSVNSRALDLSFKLSEELQPFEIDLRTLIKKNFHRGKIEIRASCVWNACHPAPYKSDNASSDYWVEIQTKYDRIKSFVPDVQRPSVEWVIREWHSQQKTNSQNQCAIISAFEESIRTLDSSRKEEGKSIASCLIELCRELSCKIQELSSLLTLELENAHRKLQEHWTNLNQALDTDLVKTDQENRIISNWLAKFDVDEEISRLSSHIQTLTNVIQTSDEPTGKRIEFFVQEMGREANTLLSKSLTGHTANLAIDIKVIIEKMKEQAQNVE